MACGHKTIGTLRTTYLVNGDGVIERIMGPKEIKTKIHAEQPHYFSNPSLKVTQLRATFFNEFRSKLSHFLAHYLRKMALR